ncbi:MAG: ABC transporter permease [Oscillospiraceae bacterium]|jgi:ABC-2 type transport system permease protein|nr:ABC transporter permease [Oscillospiraceae bacterium]
MLATFKRELGAYFTSPVGYVFIAACMLISGFILHGLVLLRGSADLSPVFMLMFFVILIFVPVLTMRLMSEDKRQKVDQLLLTAPVSLTAIVVGKFLSAYAVFIMGVCVLPVYGIVLSFFTTVSWMTLWGNFAGIVLLGGIYVALGLFVSSLTENQMIAAIGSMFLNLVMFAFNPLANEVSKFVNDFFQFIPNALRSISVFDRYRQFTLGIFALPNILFFITGIAVFLFLTVRVLERRRWA